MSTKKPAAKKSAPAKKVVPAKKVEKVGIQAPWWIYCNQLKALFEKDPEVVVHDINEQNNSAEMTMVISVKNTIKFYALTKLLKQEIKMGNITLKVRIEDVTDKNGIWTELCKAAFDGNDRFVSIEEVTDPTGGKHTFPIMFPEIIQFFDDDISDYYNNYNGIPSRVAQEVCVEDVDLCFSMDKLPKE